MTDGTERAAGEGTTRRRVMECMAWAGTGILWTFAGGVPAATFLGTARAGEMGKADAGGARALRFVQISDTHIGFNKEANPDVSATARQAVALVNAEAHDAAFVMHTGDITHLAKPEEFEAADAILKGIRVPEFHAVPGEHDVLDESRTAFFERYGKASGGKGWYGFDHGGVHFVALVNVMDFAAGGHGRIGPEQMAWLENDLKGRKASQPIVVFSHIPLWSLYPEWGWSTDDWPLAMEHMKRFGSVTVLNGHIHQVVQKVEGNVRYATARSTAFPQPAAGKGKGPGPLKVPAEELRKVLGVRSVEVMAESGTANLKDESLADA